MAGLKATKKVVYLATAKLAAAANGTIAVATLIADADLLALVDDSAMLTSLLADRIGKEWKLEGTDYVLVQDANFAGTGQYDLILIDSGQVPVGGATLELTWAEGVIDSTDGTGFTINVDASPVTFTSVATTGTTTTFTLTAAITVGQVVTVDYDASGVITDTAGRAVRPFTALAITNNTV